MKEKNRREWAAVQKSGFDRTRGWAAPGVLHSQAEGTLLLTETCCACDTEACG
jgi:hypothetical protein